MMKALAAVLALPLFGCVVGSSGTAPSGGGGDDTGGSGDGSGSGTMTGTAGHITTNATWTGTQAISASITIDPGVTVTVTAGTAITVDPNASITISGTLDIEGATGSLVTIAPSSGSSFSGISTEDGGTLTMKYTTVTGTEVETSGTGKTMISDSQLSHSPGDLLIMSGGTVTFMYSQLGSETADTTHCNMHFNAGGNTIKVSHSNIVNNPATNPSAPTYGIMFYGGQAADFTYDNWVSNSTNVDADPGVNGDFSFSYFTGTKPSGVGLTVASPAAARIAVCTGTNDATCAGPHP
jgi:hypothetical protein